MRWPSRVTEASHSSKPAPLRTPISHEASVSSGATSGAPRCAYTASFNRSGSLHVEMSARSASSLARRQRQSASAAGVLVHGQEAAPSSWNSRSTSQPGTTLGPMAGAARKVSVAVIDASAADMQAQQRRHANLCRVAARRSGAQQPAARRGVCAASISIGSAQVSAGLCRCTSVGAPGSSPQTRCQDGALQQSHCTPPRPFERLLASR
eukprot:scaffold920_cov63-Phaeocystis_antarctica.AAC.3